MGGGFGRAVGGPMAAGGPGARLRSSLDAADQEDALGKAYDVKVMKRMPRYMAWVKWSLAKAVTGTAMRTAANMAMPYFVGLATNQLLKTGNLSGLNVAVLA